MELPRFCIVGDRPVKALPTKDGGMDVLAYDWATGEFTRDMSYLHRIVMPDVEVELLTEDEFERRVAQLRGQL